MLCILFLFFLGGGGGDYHRALPLGGKKGFALLHEFHQRFNHVRISCSQVGRLRDQLQKERDLRAALEAGRSISNLPAAASLDEKVS